MTRFGDMLRAFRQASNDPDRFHRRLTQERLGALIGDEMDDLGVSGAAVSYWESGESTINVQDRSVLLALIKVLYSCGGLKTVVDANQFLRVGNYRELDEDETKQIFGEITKQNTATSFQSFLLESIFSVSEDELRKEFAKSEQGPSPAWPRKLAVLMRNASEHWSLSLSSVFWVATWALAWWLIPPSLRWPFADRDSAYMAMVLYVGGTLSVPLLIGLRVATKNSEYWNQNGFANSTLLRLYTYQGAGIGFNLGYFFVFPFILFRYYLDLGPSRWLELAAVTLGLILGNMAARVVPHNLLLAYKRLDIRDGAIFFVVALLGPLWSVFFLEYYSILLTPLLGGVIILLALTISIVITTRQSQKAQ